MNNDAFLGIVRGGVFNVMFSEQPARDALRLTNLPVQSAEPPESGEMTLEAHEGSALLVRGVRRDGWIHSAVVVDQAGQIVTMLVQVAFKTPLDPHDYGISFSTR